MRFVLGVLAFPVLVAVLSSIINFCTRVEYKVHAPNSSAVILTGASSGIGRHAAEHLARQGWTVYGSVRSTADEAELKSLNIPTLIPLRLDVTDAASRVAAVDRVKEDLAKSGKVLAALINNAGISGGLPLEVHALTDARNMFEVNYFGMMHMTQLCAPMLRKSGGRVIQVSSLAGLFATRLRGIYAGTKFALEAFSDALRMEMIPFRVSVSLVEPGFVKSSIAESSTARFKQQSAEEKEAVTLYPHLYPADWEQKKLQVIQKGDDPICTSEAIDHALSSPYPQTRYPVASVGGFDAKIVSFLVHVLPDRLREAILIRNGG